MDTEHRSIQQYPWRYQKACDLATDYKSKITCPSIVNNFFLAAFINKLNIAYKQGYE